MKEIQKGCEGPSKEKKSTRPDSGGQGGKKTKEDYKPIRQKMVCLCGTKDLMVKK